MRSALGARGRQNVSAMGISGGRLGSEEHRRRLVQAADQRGASVVLLMIGGNDLCCRDVDMPVLAELLVRLEKDLRTVGVGELFFFPVLPRRRVTGVSAQLFEERRSFLNRVWATRFRGPPVTFCNHPTSMEMIGQDGVHMSRRGRQVVMRVVDNILRKEAY